MESVFEKQITEPIIETQPVKLIENI